MDVLRARLGGAIEWIVAAAFLVATLAVASLIVRELRLQARPEPVAAAATSTTPLPSAVPERAVSVPVLPLPDGSEIRVGEPFVAVASRLGRAAESGRQEIDRGTLGERLTRFYEHDGVKFILVFEPFERKGEPRVAAIYLP